VLPLLAFGSLSVIKAFRGRLQIAAGRRTAIRQTARAEVTLEARDSLLTLAEFSIALAGFTGVVVVFGNRAGGWLPIDRYRMAIILWLSIGPAFLSLLPIGFEMLGLQGPVLWRVCSLLLAGYLVGATVAIQLEFRRLDIESRSLQSNVMFAINRAVLTVVIVGQFLNAAGIWLTPGPGALFLGLVFVLFVAAYVFARMVFIRPAQ
jgi:hypothetical protein